MGRKTLVKGTVTTEVEEGSYQRTYKIKAGEKEYSVYTQGKQAIRDVIFIRKGQEVIVEGEECQNRVLSKKSKILLKEERRSYENVSGR